MSNSELEYQITASGECLTWVPRGRERRAIEIFNKQCVSELKRRRENEVGI